MPPDKRILAELDGVDLVEDSSFTYRSNQSKSWKSIVLNHYDNCIKEGGKEMNMRQSECRPSLCSG